VRIESRIGVNTGEVVAGEGDSLTTGDAVNVAARLEQGASPGETLLGESTYRLVRDAVVAGPVEPLVAKGKSEPLTAFRLDRLVAGAEFIPRRLDSPLVGRENELAQLQRAYDHAVAERVAYQFTLLGTAGIGKSRLVRELHERVDARLLSGRCLPYGEGITYWPLAEIEPLAGPIDFGANRDEIALQARRVLERLARDRPLLVVFDDLQWAEPTFLDLIDHVTDLARDAPMLLLCVARPELLDHRPGWGGGKLNATTMLLEALTDAESNRLVDNLLLTRIDAGVKARISAAAEGNPLFLEEMLAMVADGPSGDLAVPPTIQALLAARLDRLGPDERTAVECAAIQGQEFREDALAGLVPDALAGQLGRIHQSLVRKDLVRPAGEGVYRFKHLLLRDAAYEALPKEQRADLHERFAAWIEANSPRLEEILGYHLEQSYGYRAELGPVDERAQGVARRASSALAAAGRKAFARADIHATVNLLDRAVRLLPDRDAEAVALYPDLALAVGEGGDLQRSGELYRAAEELGEPDTALLARQRRIWLELLRGGAMADTAGPMEATIAEAERRGEEAILAEGLTRLGVLKSWLGDNQTAERLLRGSLERAQRLGDARLASDALHWWLLVLLWGPTPVDEALAECRRLSQSIEPGQRAYSEIIIVQGTLHALTGDFERGRQLAAAGRRDLLELGQKVQYAGIGQPAAIIELLAGDAPAAERIMREANDILSAAGERGYLSTVTALLGLALARQGRHDEADRYAEESRRMGAEDDVITQMYWRIVKARVAWASGEHGEASRLAAEVMALTEATDDCFDGPIATLEVVDFLDPGERRPALERALAEAESKGNTVSAEQIRAKLAAAP
ncbi:MAG TPA: AAA family ATPase, partial [Gaiellaceae bacterium]